MRHSLATLKAAKANLDRQSAPNSVYGWSVDVRNNTVTVDIAPGTMNAAIDFVAASGADASTVRFNTMGDGPRVLLTLQGGSEYLASPDGSSAYYCSVGFGVTQGTAQGYATAGHCSDGRPAGRPTWRAASASRLP